MHCRSDRARFRAYPVVMAREQVGPVSLAPVRGVVGARGGPARAHSDPCTAPFDVRRSDTFDAAVGEGVWAQVRGGSAYSARVFGELIVDLGTGGMPRLGGDDGHHCTGLRPAAVSR